MRRLDRTEIVGMSRSDCECIESVPGREDATQKRSLKAELCGGRSSCFRVTGSIGGNSEIIGVIPRTHHEEQIVRNRKPTKEAANGAHSTCERT